MKIKYINNIWNINIKNILHDKILWIVDVEIISNDIQNDISPSKNHPIFKYKIKNDIYMIMPFINNKDNICHYKYGILKNNTIIEIEVLILEELIKIREFLNIDIKNIRFKHKDNNIICSCHINNKLILLPKINNKDNIKTTLLKFILNYIEIT